MDAEIKLNDEQKKYLLNLARESIRTHLLGGKALTPKTEDAMLKQDSGVFVTLEEYGSLRGCIGYIGAVQPLYLAVRDNAVNAAFEDPRFPPLTEEELPKIEIEISVLSRPKLIEAKSPDEYLKNIRPKVDGIIIEHKGRSATYLPQVWEQLPGKEDFLGSLCNKAALSSGAWKEKGAKIFSYQVDAFKESDYGSTG